MDYHYFIARYQHIVTAPYHVRRNILHLFLGAHNIYYFDLKEVCVDSLKKRVLPQPWLLHLIIQRPKLQLCMAQNHAEHLTRVRFRLHPLHSAGPPVDKPNNMTWLSHFYRASANTVLIKFQNQRDYIYHFLRNERNTRYSLTNLRNYIW